MTDPEKRDVGKFTVFYYSSYVDPVALLHDALQARVIADKGRGGIRVIETGGHKLTIRTYRHGGLFRSLTGAFFLKTSRVTLEAETMRYLREKGLPVAAPFAAVVEKLFVVRRLYLITVFEEDTVSLLEYLNTCTKRERMRAVVRFAGLLWGLQAAGVYHRDLHLRNVLVSREERLILLDFDRAVTRPLTGADVESMVRRLGRFTEKMERQGRLAVGELEKALFLRTYARLSGCDMTEKMRRGRRVRGLLHRAGWLAESLFFGGRK